MHRYIQNKVLQILDKETIEKSNKSAEDYKIAKSWRSGNFVNKCLFPKRNKINISMENLTSYVRI